MNLNQLEYFISAAETLNFTKAANKCYISQTAMTQQIKALEKTIGVPLFIRDKHHVELTNAGEIFLKEARVIVERSQKALKLVRTNASGLEGKLTIGFICGYGHGEFIEFVREFHKIYPNIQISLIRDNMSILFEKLEKGECDVIFTISPYRQKFERTDNLCINSYPLLAALDKNHPLSNLDGLKYSDLKEEKFIIMQPYRRAKDEAEEAMLIFDRGGFFPNIVAMEGDQETLLSMISIGLGISILPEYVVSPYYKDSNLVFLPLFQENGEAQTMEFECSWLKHNQNTVVERFIEVVKELI